MNASTTRNLYFYRFRVIHRLSTFDGMKTILACSAFVVLNMVIMACGNNDQPAAGDDNTGVPAPITLSFQVVNQYSHDTSAFTEGLAFYEGKLYESTGSPDEPSNSGTWIGSVDLATGKYNRTVDLGKTFFGEGITFLNDKV